MTTEVETQIRALWTQLGLTEAERLVAELDPAEETITFNDRNGNIVMRDDGQVWCIKPPKLGVLRELDLMAAKLTREATANLEVKAIQAEPGDVPQAVADELAGQPESRGLHEQVEETLPWWQLLFERCADRPFPEPDDCPIWMGGVVLISVLLTHWMTYPLRGRGVMPLLQSVEAATGQLNREQRRALP